MKNVAAVLLVVGVIVGGVASCGSAHDPALEGCANGSHQACEQVKQNEQVDSEAHEVESVIKKRQAEERASALEGR